MAADVEVAAVLTEDKVLSGIFTTADGVALANGDRVLARGQASSTQNDIYIVNSSGVWSRDLATTIEQWMDILVTEGLNYAGSRWTLSTPTPVRDGSAPLLFPFVSAPTNDLSVDEDADNESMLQIEGLRLVYDGAAALTVEAGSAWVPQTSDGKGAVVALDEDYSFTGMTLTAATWYYVYLYDNAGTGAVEYSTQRPDDPYLGDARTKGGPDNTDPTLSPNSTRRFIGAIRCSGTANTMRRFAHRGDVIYYQETGVAVNLPGAATAYNLRDLSAWVPPTSRSAQLHFQTNGSAGVEVDLDADNGTAQTLRMAPASGNAEPWLYLTSAQAIRARNTAGSGSTDISVMAYRMGR